MRHYRILSASIIGLGLLTGQPVLAMSYQDANVEYSSHQQALQQQQQIIQQSYQGSIQSLQQSMQQWQQTVQQQQNVNMQALIASGNFQRQQQAFQQSQQSIQTTAQNVQQSLNTVQQAIQQVAQNAQQSTQQGLQNISQAMNSGNFDAIAGYESADLAIIAKEKIDIQAAIDQSKAGFVAQQGVVANMLAAQAALGGGGAATTTPPVVTPPAPVAVNGVCGGANGTTVASAPSANLCSTGSASAVGGSGPFTWSCAGSNGGSAATCSAAKTAVAPVPVAVNGACGSANGATVASAPTGNLCSVGSASGVSGAGPFSWSCSGSNGGGSASCSAALTATTKSAGNFINASDYVASYGPLVTFAPNIGYLSPGEWVKYGNVDFGGGMNKFSALVAVNDQNAGQGIQARVDSPTGTIIATLTVASTGSFGNFATQSTTALATGGVHDVYLTFSGYGGVANLGGFQFSNEGVATSTPVTTTPVTTAPVTTPTPTPTPTQTAVVSPAFFVSPTGNDGNNGTSTGSPFQTLERAKAALEGSSTKTVYLLGGTYLRSQSLDLTSWNDGNQSWLAYPGQTPVLDGQNMAANGFNLLASGITINGITIQNFTQNGVFAKWCDNITVTNNTILNIKSPDWRTGILGASVFVIHSKNDVISHNLINGNTGQGLEVNGGGSGDDQSGAVVSYNKVFNTCSATDDCGGIYFRDVGHASTGMFITNNVVANVLNSNTKGIYLDDETSNVTVQNNIVYGSATYGIQFHGGDHNVVQNNIFDITNMMALALYQDDVTSGMPNYGMGSNSFTGNIVYSSGGAKNLWDYLNGSGGYIASPYDYNNLYYAASGSFSNNGAITDGKWTSGNPGFSNPSAGNYTLTNSSANAIMGFQAIDMSKMGPQ